MDWRLIGVTAGPPAAPGDSLEEVLERARIYALQILSGARSPIDGARRIWWDAFNALFDHYHEGNEAVDKLAIFVALADEWEEVQDRESDRLAVEASIVEEAKAFVSMMADGASPET